MKALSLREQAEVQAELQEELTMQDVLEMSAALDRWDAEMQEGLAVIGGAI